MKKPRKVFNVFLSVAYGLLIIAPWFAFFALLFRYESSGVGLTSLFADFQNNRLLYYYMRSVGSQIYSLYSWCSPFDSLHWAIYGAINQGTDGNYFLLSYFIYVLYVSSFYVITKLVIAIPMLVDKVIERLGA